MSNKKIVLLSGGTGKFAKHLIEELDHNKYDICAPSSQEMDITNRVQIKDFIEHLKPDYFIHCAALTRPMVIHNDLPDKSIMVNIIGTANVVLECMRYNIKLVYISTDHVYEGTRGNYKEKDPILPINNYAWSKLGGECSVVLYENSCILRMAMADNPFPHKFALTDSYKSLIFSNEAAKIVEKFLDKIGIYNIGGKRQTIYDFVKKSHPEIGKISLKQVKDVNMPKDVSMDLNKMKGVILNEN